MKTLSNRSAVFTDSIIRRMTRISQRYDAVNLSQGFPDFDPPQAVLERLAQVAFEGPHQYSLTWGAKNCRDALAKKFEHFAGTPIDPESEIVITCGGTEAMMSAVLTIVNPKDKIAIFSPFYENYGADAILSGAEPIYIPLRPPNYDFVANDLENAFRAGAKALILCNPSNPCGKVFTREELLAILALAQKYDAWIITDEVYEHIVYAPFEHIYFSTLPGARERTIICGSLSKTYSITGWRLGYVIAPANIIDRAKKVHDFLTVGAAAPLQEAIVPALKFGDEYYQDLQNKYTQKRELFLNGLDAIGLTHNTPQGAYYVMVDISKFGFASDLEFCETLAREVKVGAVPGSSFFHENEQRYIRFHFAKKEERLRAALANLATIHERIKH